MHKPKASKTDNFWKPRRRKERKDKLSQEVQVEVRSFFYSPEISREVPNKRDVKGNQQKHIMTMTLLYPHLLL